jgi:cardiolipin synthase A/B
MEIALAIIGSVIVTSLVWLVYVNTATGEKKIREPIEAECAVGNPHFMRVLSSMLGPDVRTGNRVQSFQNGDEIFPAMLEAIRAAQESITFETYIYWSGGIGKEFSDALVERSRAGVRVHVLLDWAGSAKIDQIYLKEMRRAGVEVERYHPLRWYSLRRLNNRTHRKLLVVDGRIGFTGGVGIADKWTGHAQDKEHWRDSHYRIEGPAVAQMQAAFIDNWIKVRGCVLHEPPYFPELREAGRVAAQVFRSSRDEGSESVRLMYSYSIAAARKNIRLAAAYFVPDDLAVETLKRACRRGVFVEIIVPGPIIDSRLVRKASRARWGKLLEAGVAIYEYQPTMFHSKAIIVDDVWVSVGSTNFDNRSFRLNAEANLNILDAEFAAEQARVFEQDKQRSIRMTLERYRQRPLREKITERLGELLRSQL